MGHICDEYGGVIKRDVCSDFFFSHHGGFEKV